MRWDSTTGLACSHLPPTYLAPPPWTDRRAPGQSCWSDRPLVQQPPWSPEQAQDTAGCVHGRRPEVSLHEPNLTEQQMSATSKRREQPPRQGASLTPENQPRDRWGAPSRKPREQRTPARLDLHPDFSLLLLRSVRSERRPMHKGAKSPLQNSELSAGRKARLKQNEETTDQHPL